MLMRATCPANFIAIDFVVPVMPVICGEEYKLGSSTHTSTYDLHLASFSGRFTLGESAPVSIEQVAAWIPELVWIMGTQKNLFPLWRAD
jgi:hypothetical protein